MFATVNECLISASRNLERRAVHANAKIIENCVTVRNRNPRNLERLRIARKPIGYHLDAPKITYYHKLDVTKKNRYIVVEANHFENGPVVVASSAEWAIKKFLYDETDKSAYRNLGRIFARRCLESGICEIETDFETPIKSEKLEIMLDEIQKNGVNLHEYPRYIHPAHYSWEHPEKPWESFE